MTAEAVTEKVQPLTLIVDETPHGHGSATFPVRWRISPEMQQEIVNQEIENPYIVIVVANGGEEIFRIVRPLTAQMAFLQVPKVGKATVYGLVVYRRFGTKDLLDQLQSKRRVTLFERERPGEAALDAKINQLYGEIETLKNDLGIYDNWDWDSADDDSEPVPELTPEILGLIAQRDELIVERENLYANVPKVAVFTPRSLHYALDAAYLGEPDSFDIDIPDFLFAKERPWMKTVGSILPWWNTKPPRDQCDLRNRVLWTLIGSPVWIAAALIVGTLFLAWWVIGKVFIALWVGILLFCGFRGINYAPLLQLGNLSISEVNERLGSSIWTTKRVNGEYHPVSRGPVFYVLSPVTIVLTVLGAWLLSLLGAGLSLIPVVVYIIVLVAIVATSSALIRYSQNAGKRQAERLSRFQRGLQQVTYDGTADVQASIDALPKERRTLYLKFWDLKSQVCKPFAR
ncbi:MAG: hypothetical protein ABIP74_00840 [Candidatus Saccharimonas sp.]